jgi:hypothetical protein
VKLTIAFFDGVLNGTISDEEFARYAPALGEILADGSVPATRQLRQRKALPR